ncbi:PQQ-binding-like beta-propeller repeat protein [Actinomadura madurae]|nr:PQQ-binding-like beta-propeller repeat protein [Actinomadura madurae]MCQ0005650.1 PQQ-binding-like beta-propeller repeat protein [Actinomadura madurae]
MPPKGAGLSRRRALAGLAGAALAGGAVAWPWTDGTKPVPAAPVPDGPLLWTADVQFADGAFFGPATSGGLLVVERPFAVEGQRGTRATALSCLDAATGRRLWSVPLAPSLGTLRQVAVTGSSVLVRTEEALQALDHRTGRPIWRHERPTTTLGEPMVLGDGGLVLDVTENDAGTEFAPPFAAEAYEARDGRLRWSTTVQPQVWAAKATIHAAGTLFGAAVTSAPGAGQTAFLYALDAATGRQLWWRALKRDLGQTPTITLAHAGGSVFASLDGGLLVAVDASTGAIRWNTRIDLDGRGSRRPRGADVPVTAGTTVYLCCADGALRAFDMRDGRPRWEFAMDEEPSSMKSVPARPRPIVADDLVYVTSLGTASTGSKGAMHVLGDGDGKPRWRRPADKSHGGPLLKRDVVCLSDGASVTAYDAAGRRRSPPPGPQGARPGRKQDRDGHRRCSALRPRQDPGPRTLPGELTMEPLLPGDPERIGGYRCVARLGTGGMGDVFFVQADTGAPAALKLIHPDLAEDPGFRARFAREVGAMRRVSGSYTAALLDAGDDPRPWLATAYLPGLSLQEAVTRHGPLSIEATRRLGSALAEALASIHAAGVVHRDLKPGNILLTGDGPRVVDFGIAGGHDLTGTDGTFAGTPAYMAPERWTGGPAAPPADVFALGAVLVFCRTGAPPQDGLTQDHPPDDQGLGAVIEACLATDPSQRPTTEQVASALSPGATGTDWLPPTMAVEIAERATMSLGFTAPPPGRAWPARRRVLAQIGGMGAVALASAAAVRTLPGTSPAAASVLWTARATMVTGSELGPELDGRLLFLDRTVVTDSGPARVDLCCLDTTGRHRWRRPLPHFERQTGGVVAALGSVWVRSGRETLLLDPGTGLVRRSWRRAFAGLAPAVAFGDALAYDLAASTTSREGATVYAHEPRTGRIVWERRIDGRPVSPLTVAGNTVYVVSASASGRWERVHALDSAAGTVRWTSDHDDDVIRLKSIAPRYTDATLRVVDGTVYVSVEGRVIHALDARHGRGSLADPSATRRRRLQAGAVPDRGIPRSAWRRPVPAHRGRHAARLRQTGRPSAMERLHRSGSVRGGHLPAPFHTACRAGAGLRPRHGHRPRAADRGRPGPLGEGHRPVRRRARPGGRGTAHSRQDAGHVARPD